MIGYRPPRRASLRQVLIAAAVLIAVLVLVTVAWNGRVGGWW